MQIVINFSVRPRGEQIESCLKDLGEHLGNVQDRSGEVKAGQHGTVEANRRFVKSGISIRDAFGSLAD